MLGAPLTVLNPALAGTRKWRVKDFDRFLIFYRPRPGGVLILRVLLNSQDWWILLGLVGPSEIASEWRPTVLFWVYVSVQ